ncbi:uncharacterized protein PITG_22425, partial [Phytophthora infestans T30-4]
CTGLSSDEEQESEEDDDDDDNWVEDWVIGKLTDGDAEKDGGSPGIGVPVGGEGQAEDLQDESGRVGVCAESPQRGATGTRFGVEENPDTVIGEQGVQRSCKVCAIYKVQPRKFTNICNGLDIPRLLLNEHKLRHRPPPSHPGKKRRRRESEAGEAHSDDVAAEQSDGNADESAGNTEGDEP